jgi:(S)-2-hydroxyglutarate dehydrogenase
MKNVAIIGGGILGLAIGYKLSLKVGDFKVTVFEKETEVGCHQSGRNSGVLHCGLNYKPNSLKAQLAVEGIREMILFCKQNEVKFDQCGKIVVATNSNENKVLQDLANRGKLNGLKNLKFLNKDEINRREPNIVGMNALLVPEEGIVDYKGVMLKLVELIKSNKGEVFFNTEINNIVSKNNKSIINHKSKENTYDLVINCSGLHSDRVFKNLTHTKRPVRIVPFRGEYMSFKDEYKDMVNHLVYPVPNPKFPFLGVHFTRMINGDREVGPNAVLAFKREGYKNTDFSIRDSFDSLTYKGLHNFVKNNFNFALGEFSSSLSKKSFIKKAKKMMPEINSSMLIKGGAGVRAQALDPNGNLLMDFRVERFGNQIHVLNAPSPGATASLAISNYIINNYINN